MGADPAAFAAQRRSVYEADLRIPKRRLRCGIGTQNAGLAREGCCVSGAGHAFRQDLTLVALGGEVVVDYALRAKREYAGEPLIVAGYSNNVMCYIPSADPERRRIRSGRQHDLLRAAGPFAAGVETVVFDAIHQAMKKVGRVNRFKNSHRRPIRGR